MGDLWGTLVVYAEPSKGTIVAIEKPLPMQIGDKYYFTLTSYDPVSITVRVPTVIDADVDNALEDLAMGMHLELSELDDAKVAELYQGRVNTLAELRERLRRELGDYNAANAEQSKGRLCGEVLAERLCQQVPPRMIAEHAHYLSLQFAQELAQEGEDVNKFLAEVGITPEEFEQRFHDDARRISEQVSALDAYADEKKVTVADDEVAGLLPMPLAEAEKLVEDARAHGAFSELRDAARRNKVVEILVASCSCTYEHETPAQAEVRAEQYRKMLEAGRELMAFRAEHAESGKPEDKGEDSGFKLV